jgi:hypothetical protein
MLMCLGENPRLRHLTMSTHVAHTYAHAWIILLNITKDLYVHTYIHTYGLIFEYTNRSAQVADK